MIYLINNHKRNHLRWHHWDLQTANHVDTWFITLISNHCLNLTEQTFTCSKSTLKTLEKEVKYAQIQWRLSGGSLLLTLNIFYIFHLFYINHHLYNIYPNDIETHRPMNTNTYLTLTLHKARLNIYRWLLNH